MTNLQTIQGLNVYCGPAVLSALTGKSTDECASVISAISGKREIKAVQMDHLILALKKLRFDCTPISKTSFSLFGVLNSLSHNDGFYIITVPKHVVAIEVINRKIFLIDNHSKQPILAESSARLGQKVDLIYKIVKLTEPKFISSRIVLEKHSGLIYINRKNTYENEEDNTQTYIGRLSYDRFEELEEIINELAKVGQV